MQMHRPSVGKPARKLRWSGNQAEVFSAPTDSRNGDLTIGLRLRLSTLQRIFDQQLRPQTTHFRLSCNQHQTYI